MMNTVDVPKLCKALTLKDKEGPLRPLQVDLKNDRAKQLGLRLVKLVNREIQIHRAPLLWMGAEIGRFLGSMIGDVAEIDEGNQVDRVGKYIRVRVVINVSKPLCQILRFDVMQDGKETTMLLRYEHLPEQCFQCGYIGHVVWECLDEGTGNGAKDLNLMYCAWLKASSPIKNQYRSRKERWGTDRGGGDEGSGGMSRSEIRKAVTLALLDDGGKGKAMDDGGSHVEDMKVDLGLGKDDRVVKLSTGLDFGVDSYEDIGTCRSKTGKWKIWARDGVEIDNGLVAGSNLEKTFVVEGNDNANIGMKFVKIDDGA
ncbi:hypothetical protein Dsin_002499 [Dipteronia sinensis]|uniref:CCHC-type domain-containing protein n=1 Tax=Dipteronia sinensis TaxID=43782 RepID=A0AAE0EJB6_9ROSI|nr:hypothetical protein Dsin_002499 [Dipteronia sinensis]